MINPKDKRTLVEVRTFIQYPREVNEAVGLLQRLLRIVDGLEKEIDTLNEEAAGEDI